MKKFLKVIGKTLLYMFTTLIVFVLLAFAVGFIYVDNTTKNLPSITTEMLKSDASSNIYANDGQTLIYSTAENKRKLVKLADVPQKYKDLLLMTEDAEFYEHRGISPKGTLNAVLSKAKSIIGKNEQVRGGSSITQQLVKLTVFSTDEKDRTLSRKVKEAFLAEKLYDTYSRDEILEFYINKLYLGEGSYGAQTIANTYFGKDLNQLSISQLAIIAGLGQSPSEYNLYDNPEAVEKRRNIVLYEAYRRGKLTSEEYTTAKNTPIQDGLMERRWQGIQTDTQTIQHSAYVTSTLEQLKSLGYDPTKLSLQVVTNLSVSDNNYLSDVMNNSREYYVDDREQSAATLIDPKNGHVIAQFGGRFNNELFAFNRATSKTRSSGSSIKPIADYGPAIEYLGWGSGSLIDSSNYVYPGTNLVAYNYGLYTYGNVTMSKAMELSLNTPALRTLEQVGPERATDFVNKVGIKTSTPVAGSQGLGIDASSEEMAAAFATISNGGTYYTPAYVNNITFSDGSKKEIQLPSYRAMSESTAYILTTMLKGVTGPNGTAKSAAIPGISVAAKTGTVAYPDEAGMPSLSAMDTWVVGYTKSLSLAIWQGYDNPMEPNSYIPEYLTTDSKGSLFKTLMSTYMQGKDGSDWQMPANVINQGGYLKPASITSSEGTKLLYESNVQNKDLFDTLVPKSTNTDYKVTWDKNTFKIPDGYKIGDWKTEFEKKKADEKAEDDKLYSEVEQKQNATTN